MGRRYRNPPLLEAVCEFRLTQDTYWDLTIPGLFYERVKDEFGRREQRVVQELELAQETQSVEQRVRTSERALFFTEDRRMIIQLGPRLLVINALRPYPSWEAFKRRIDMAWKILQEVVEVTGLDRIGLRYINEIQIPDQPADLHKYLAFYPFVGQSLPQRMVSFIAGAVFPYADDRDRCRVQVTPAGGDRSAVILDIDYFLARSRAVSPADASEWVEQAHGEVEAVFEGCVTERLRSQFDEVC